MAFYDPETGQEIEEKIGSYAKPVVPRSDIYNQMYETAKDVIKNIPNYIKQLRFGGVEGTPPFGTHNASAETKKTGGNGPVFNIYAEKTGQGSSPVIAPAPPSPWIAPSVSATDLLRNRSWTGMEQPRQIIPTENIGPDQYTRLNATEVPRTLPNVPTQYFMRNPNFGIPGYEGATTPEYLPVQLNSLTKQYEPIGFQQPPSPSNFETMGEYAARRALPVNLPPENPNEVFRYDANGNLVPMRRYTGQFGTTWQEPTAGTWPITPTSNFYATQRGGGALPVNMEEFNRVNQPLPGEGGPIQTINMRGPYDIAGRGSLQLNPKTGWMEPVIPPLGALNPLEEAKLENAKAIQLLHNQGELEKVKALGGNAESLARLTNELGKAGKTLADYYFQLQDQSQKSYDAGAINQTKPMEERMKDLQSIANLNWKIANTVWANTHPGALPIGGVARPSGEATRILREAETLPQWKQMTEDQRTTFKRMVMQKYQ